MVWWRFRIFWKAFFAYLLVSIFTLLWTLLLIIPGIIAAYSFSLTFFILAEDLSVKPLDAIRRIKEMMRGQKWKLAWLQGRFIGWYVLALLKCGIGMLWVVPYYRTSLAHFYDDVKSMPSLPA